MSKEISITTPQSLQVLNCLSSILNNYFALDFLHLSQCRKTMKEWMVFDENGKCWEKNYCLSPTLNKHFAFDFRHLSQCRKTMKEWMALGENGKCWGKKSQSNITKDWDILKCKINNQNIKPKRTSKLPPPKSAKLHHNCKIIEIICYWNEKLYHQKLEYTKLKKI